MGGGRRMAWHGGCQGLEFGGGNPGMEYVT